MLLSIFSILGIGMLDEETSLVRVCKRKSMIQGSARLSILRFLLKEWDSFSSVISMDEDCKEEG
jgi:hypothetical protein